MDIIISVSSVVPVYEQIIVQVCQGITGGDLTVGDSLPPIRQLARDLSITPATVAKAYHILEQNLIIETGGRRGTFIHSMARDNVTQFIKHRTTGNTREFITTQLRAGICKADLKQIFLMTLESL